MGYFVYFVSLVVCVTPLILYLRTDWLDDVDLVKEGVIMSSVLGIIPVMNLTVASALILYPLGKFMINNIDKLKKD